MQGVDRRLVRLLADGDIAPGRYETRLGSGTSPAGIYFCVLDTGDKRLRRKVVIEGQRLAGPDDAYRIGVSIVPCFVVS